MHESERKEETRLGEEVEVLLVIMIEVNSMVHLAHERLDDDGQVIFDLLVEYEGELPFGINQAQSN